MRKIVTTHPDVWILEPQVFGDYRGYFMETWSTAIMHELGLQESFVQDNQSFTAQKNTIRGLHFQKEPMSQCKLVRVTQGAVMDVAVDLRKGSPNYLSWVSAELSEDNKRMLFIPRGFAHGFLTLSDNVIFQYKVDNLYSKECDRSVRFDDLQIGVDWRIADPILSDKDKAALFFKDSDCNFIYNY